MCQEMLNYGPSFLGCIFFCIGSFIECKHNKVWEVATGIKTLVWWVCMNNAVGMYGTLTCVTHVVTFVA